MKRGVRLHKPKKKARQEPKSKPSLSGGKVVSRSGPVKAGVSVFDASTIDEGILGNRDTPVKSDAARLIQSTSQKAFIKQTSRAFYVFSSFHIYTYECAGVGWRIVLGGDFMANEMRLFVRQVPHAVPGLPGGFEDGGDLFRVGL